MKQIPIEKIRKDNTNLRKYDDKLWRVLRKERFKKAVPDLFVNEMAAEQQAHRDDPHNDFNADIETFIKTKLSAREAAMFRLFVYGGKINQVEIGDILGVSQSTVANTLKATLELFRVYYYAEINNKRGMDCE